MMTFLLALFVGFLSVAIPVLGQMDCSKPSAMLRSSHGFPECCDQMKWTKAAIEQKCDNQKDPVCAVECYFRQAKLINSNNEWNDANAKSLLEEKLKREPEYLPIAIKAFNKCYALAKKSGGNKKHDSCTVIPAWTVDCLMRHLFANCLPNKWKSSPSCEADKVFVQKCPVITA